MGRFAIRKVKLYLIAILTILLSFCSYEITIYQYLTPRLIWSVETLKLNVEANRKNWLDCKFGIKP